MSIVYKNGRLVRESDEERNARLALASSSNAATQEQFDKQRMFGSAAQKNLVKAGRALSIPTATVGAYDPSANKGKGNRVSLTTGETVAAPKADTGKGTVSTTAKAKADTDKALKEAQDRALAYASGMQAVADYEQQAKDARTAALGRLSDVYDPQEKQINDERARQLKILEGLITQGQSDISQAEIDFLNAVKPTSAYSNMPMVDMQAIQNPLLEALRQQGAGEGAVQSQSAMDKSLNDFMNQLQAQSATRYGDVQQNYLESLKNAARGGSLAGRTFLGQRQPEITAGIESDYSKMLNELATARAGSEASVEDQLNDALSKIIELKAKTTAESAPLTTTGDTKPTDGAETTGVKGPKPSTPAGVGMHWEWNGMNWVAVPNKVTGTTSPATSPATSGVAENAAVAAGFLTQEQADALRARRGGF
jgi:hypothetical protein